MVTPLKKRIIQAIDELTEEQQQKLWVDLGLFIDLAGPRPLFFVV